MPRRRLRVLTWHVHGNYLYYLTQVPHDFHLVTDDGRTPHHSGCSGALPWGDNVHEVHVSRIREMEFDVILFQSRDAWESEQHQLLGAAQRALPRIYLEHDPPQEHPTNTRHWVQDRNALLVHCTHFNALMWDSGITPVRVVEHGVKLLSQAAYRGERAEGLVVVNHLLRRGRRLGLDVYLQVREQVPLSLVGMGSLELAHAGGRGEVENHRLAEVMAGYRFFFNPIRYTSLGLSVIEAMMVGVPVVGLATTELANVIRSGDNGLVDTRLPVLVEAMQRLIDDPGLARAWGERGRRTALERFGIERFVRDWLAVFDEVTG
ncbi:glycosyltransferase [Caldimonas thermodepolymerans]|uniref:Glycosyl transferase family 1 n=1 Tax=Caldimonas thermodepolymerans TaxID=215580 RepID=A0AA46DE45_9BURK|nr:glycosyltransferase family 4 protein [Caldimonas thermodepolymerans]TCP06771.1 glycosyl transferase family 1 [Caldimonas thermodepolymerans]UZG49179.1 glycosyltransferase family 4 protein [Caldimonas thermodepolymerans]